MQESQNRYPCINLPLPAFPGALDPAWEQAQDAQLLEVESGLQPFLSTSFRVLRDDAQQALFIRFEAQDDCIRSTYRLHDETLYTQDVFELFVSDGENLYAYKEIEVSPYDLHFTGTISYTKEGTRVLDMGWDIPGFQTHTTFDKQKNQTYSVWKLPYAAFVRPPAPGTSWRVNAFRVDHSPRGEELQAWQPTGQRNFHVPERFGWLDFFR